MSSFQGETYVCGRFVLYTPARDLAKQFDCGEYPEIAPRYNISPTQVIHIVRNMEDSSGRVMKPVKWGLIPSWAKDESIGSSLINARAETVAVKPAFRRAFKAGRCLIPANGYYEWKKDGRKRRPFYFRGNAGEVLAFAGICEKWKTPDGVIIESAAILTTDSSELSVHIHDRMPVIVSGEDYVLWLDPKADPAALETLVQKARKYELIGGMVDSRVNKSEYNGPDCIAVIPEQVSLPGGNES